MVLTSQYELQRYTVILLPEAIQSNWQTPADEPISSRTRISSDGAYTYLVIGGHMWYELKMEVWLHIGQRGCQGGHTQEQHHSCCQYW
jgi:hypothetical protein